MLNDLLRALAPLVSQDWVIVGIVVCLAAWAVCSGWRLGLAAGRVRRALDAAQAVVARSPDEVAFAGAYEEVSARLSKDRVLGPGWLGFSQGLIVPAVPGRPVLATGSLRDWFDLNGLLRRAGADPRYHAALPGLLVGAGLLFTFFGLAAALSAAGEVVAEGVDQASRNAALRALLGAASVKFVTSLAGLFLSIAYALFRKRRLQSIEEAAAGFFAECQKRLPTRTAASLQAEGNVLLGKQYADVQRIGNDFFVTLGSTLEREFGNGLQQHVGPLADAIEKLTAKLSNQTEDAMQAMLRAFLERLEGAVGDSMRGTAATIDALGARLDGLQAGLEAAAQRMGRAAEEMAAGMGRGAEAALGGITDQMGALVRTLRETADEAGRNNRAAGDDLAQRMAATADGLTAAVAQFQARLEEGAASGVGRLAAPIEALLGQLRDLADGQRQAGAESTAVLSATVTRAAEALEATAAKVADSLGAGASDASRRLVAATEAMRDDLRAAMERFGTALDASGTALTQGAAAGGDLLRSAGAALGDDLDKLVGRLREAGETAGNALREGGNEARSGMADAAHTLVQGSAGLADRTAALGSASAVLTDQTSALDRAIRAAASPLAAGAADLRTAGEAARGAAEPLQAVAQAARAALDGLAGAGLAVDAANRRAEDLAGRFAAAADRFENLDQGIAGTLRALNDGLAGFQRNIAAFVADIDNGLQQSVAGLTAVAKNLEDSVEELGEIRHPVRG